MKESEYLFKFLNIEQPMEKNPNKFSTAVLLLRGARYLFGCNVETGVYEYREYDSCRVSLGIFHSLQFNGLISYLIFLEQIGSIFVRNIPKNGFKNNGIYKALQNFSSLKDNDSKIGAIVSLRNALVHKFGLATEKQPQNGPARKFLLSLERKDEIVINPEQDWNGDFAEKSEQFLTKIHIIDLVAAIEVVYSNVLRKLESDDIEIKLNDGKDELDARFTIML